MSSYTPLNLSSGDINTVLNAAAIGDMTTFHNSLSVLSTRENRSALQILVQVRNQDGENVLHRAAGTGNTAILTWLLEPTNFKLSDLPLRLSLLTQRKHIFGQQNFGDTPLHRACLTGSLTFASQLLGSSSLLPTGSLAGMRGNAGMTPLMVASNAGHLPIVQKLLSEGAIVNEKGPGDQTALHYAAMKDAVAISAELLDHGADARMTNAESMTPTALAMRHGKAGARALFQARGLYD
ncbi:hypothetical protein MKZ38_005519 [Zalerion maritima]|uniref:Uncharacterized protein n=1 Tax=Zalerion maritima TaxID=339359 RepID=A0AAD5WW55_9PEZI|nr:hypothetical protein MKZ38_005519 [Zalerion maritima]